MCLAESYEKMSGRRTGYKLLYTNSTGYETGQCKAGTVAISKTRYTTDPNEGHIDSHMGFTYPAGFHILLDKRSARRVQREESQDGHYLELCSVAFKDEVAYGEVRWHFGGKPFATKTVVAKKCRIIDGTEEE